MGIFSKFMNIKAKEPPSQPIYLTGAVPIFTPFSGNAYANDIYRGAVDAIARNTAKLKGAHVIRTPTSRDTGATSINRLLQVRPNPYMSAYDMIYRIVTHLYLYNNAFALLQRDERGNLSGIYPLRAASIEFLSDQADSLYCKFLFNNGNEYTFPYTDIVHLRRNFNDNDLLGDPNTALMTALEMAHTQNQGIIAAIENSATIRGILKFTNVLSPEKQKEEKERFVADYMNISNNGGVVVTDSKGEYIPINSTPYTIDERQIQATKEKIYTYLGISETVVNSSYTESEWGAFYESVIEPIAVQLSLEFTAKVFTQREQGFGNAVLFEANRLQFASAATKTALIEKLMPMGLLSINQALEILNLPSVEDGDRRIFSLNYINAERADEYQLGKERLNDRVSKLED